MPTHKPDLSRLSISQLREVTGCSYKTIVKRLEGLAPADEDGKTVWYLAKEALPRIYGYDNPLAEKIRLDAARADAQEMKNAEARGEQIPGEQIDEYLFRLIGAFVQRIRAIPPKAAPEVRAGASDAEAEAILTAFHDEALTELAAAGRRAADRLARRASREAVAELRSARADSSTAAETDGERVVRRGADAEPGEQRGAGAVEDGEG